MNFDISEGQDHLKLLDISGAKARKDSQPGFKKHSMELRLLGTCLSALYQAGTCYRKCHAQGHVLEALAGRTYNLTAAAYTLITLRYYDEALNLTRSIGEVANLISLSVVDKQALRDWLNSDKNTRLKEFKPAKVRKMLKDKDEMFLLADQDWYSNLCEKYTHITPQTIPNMHGEIGIVGGVYQENGMELALNKLVVIVAQMSMLICRYFDFDELVQKIDNHIESEIDHKN